MTVATTIVNSALRLLNLNNGILPVDPAHQVVAFECLVDMLHALRGDDLYVVRQFPATITADLKEQSWATAGLKEMLAKYSAPYLQSMVPDNIGSEGERILRNRARPPIACALPDTLPTGSGNTGHSSFAWPYRFFSGDDGVEYSFSGSVNKGESGTYYADFDYDATLRATTVASVVWSNLKSATAAISGAALSGNLASATLAFGTQGDIAVRARATYANAQIKDYLFDIGVA